MSTEQTSRTPSGFFISHWTDHLFGWKWRTVVSTRPEAVKQAEAWIHTPLLQPATVTAIRQQYYSDPRVFHVALSNVLHPERAAQIFADLQVARFVRHHHTHYPLWIAPRQQQEPSVLTSFVDWLCSRDAAMFHSWWVCWPHPLPEPLTTQVQVSRMGVGDHFPLHHDTDEEGIAVVYNFTAGWQKEWGGALCFPHPHTGRHELILPPQFNSLLLFRPQHAPHLVTPVLPTAENHYRYTVTVFYTT